MTWQPYLNNHRIKTIWKMSTSQRHGVGVWPFIVLGVKTESLIKLQLKEISSNITPEPVSTRYLASFKLGTDYPDKVNFVIFSPYR
jgi:hypothetical protein